LAGFGPGLACFPIEWLFVKPAWDHGDDEGTVRMGQNPDSRVYIEDGIRKDFGGALSSPE